MRYNFSSENTLNRTPNWTSVLPALVIPICLGMSLYLGLVAAIEKKLIVDEWLLRYLTGHPISKVTTFLFLVGFASLAGIAWNVFRQFIALNGVADRYRQEIATQPGETGTSEITGESSPNNADASEVATTVLESVPLSWKDHYLVNRIQELVAFCERKPSAESFEDELKYQSDLAQERKSNRYSLARILIWATPMLGFLGTVLGISQALGGINVGADNDFGQMMSGLQSSLYIAFDTTALALTLSMVLMFQQFLVDRFETELLRAVDFRVKHLVTAPAVALNQLARSDLQDVVLQTNQVLVQQQADLWRSTISEAEAAWVSTVSQANEEIRTRLSEAVDGSVEELANCLGQAIQHADVSMDRRWKQWQVLLSENARQMGRQQHEMARQTELVVRMAADVTGSNAIRRNKNQYGELGSTESESKSGDSLKLWSGDGVLEQGVIQTLPMTPELWQGFQSPIQMGQEGQDAPAQTTAECDEDAPRILKFPGQSVAVEAEPGNVSDNQRAA